MNEELIDARSIELAIPKQRNIARTISHNCYIVVKRLADVAFALVGLLCMIPLMLVVKLSYICSGDFHSIFYSHNRVGKNGKIFKMYKFRSMVPNADKVLVELLQDPKYKKEWEENQKLDKDPRITKMGKILRKTSLDEMPQFINVLKGDMSLIGPRPLLKGELDAHNGNHSLYESVQPGITSWWASHGRSATTYEERLGLEYYYIRNQSFKLDIKCILATIKAVVHRTGAK